MSDEEIGEIKDELKAYKEQLDVLREDLKLLIRHSPNLRTIILATANQQGNPGYDQAELRYAGNSSTSTGSESGDRLVVTRQNLLNDLVLAQFAPSTHPDQ